MPREAGWWMHVTPSLPLAEATVEVEGLPIYYRTGGSGPPLLLLHGFTVTGRMWDPFLDELGKHSTVIVPDLPGHGRSSRSVGPFLFPDAARCMFGLLDALGVELVRGIGISGGAMVLLHMALQDSQRLDAAVIMSGAHRMLDAQRAAQKRMLWDSMDPASQDRQLELHPGGVPQIEWILAQARSFGDGHGGYEASPEQLAKIQTRTLLVWGDQDVVFPLELALEMYRSIPSAALWVIPGGGHGIIWDSPRAGAEFPGLVHAFFEGKLGEV
ncbi:MAG: alpha/beta hydrolase [Chloroflexi bacterium]|nr:alpha/beta hydrolase [Chloroflexota bacterium]